MGIFKRPRPEGRAAAPELLRRAGDELVRRRIQALWELMARIHGSDRLVLKAGKLNALQDMRAEDPGRQLVALQRLIHEDPTIDQPPEPDRLPEALDELEEAVADLLARKHLEAQIEQRVAERMQARHEEYLQELRLQVLKEETGPDNAHTLKKLATLEKLDQRRLSRSVAEVLRPRSLSEVVGQERAIEALMARVCSPFPSHVLIYGPPGVGKTTVARLVLEEAKRRPYTPFAEDAPFVEVNGATLRWDPREVTNPLLGSVHDPIYQGARRELADSAVPEPKPGLVTEAHGGVLFIDEIGELDPLLQNKLLKVLEDKRVYFDSAYYDPDDPKVPRYIRKLFEEGAPADFVLIGATTRSPDEINPALRSRCAEVFFDPLTEEQVCQIVMQAAERLGVELDADVPARIGRYIAEGRMATRLLADAYSLVLHRTGGRQPVRIRAEDVTEVAHLSRLSSLSPTRIGPLSEIGRALGLGVSRYVGSVVEIEAVAFPAREPGKGKVRFNETAGTMYRDSVFNVASVVRKVAGIDLSDWDVHVNVVGGGRIDGPSAGAAIFVAVLSAIQGRPVRQDTAMTGEISIQGLIRPVGGVYEKLHGARRAGLKRVLIPADNAAEIGAGLAGVEVVAVATVGDILPHVFAQEEAARGA
ncbi:MAG: ATP-dependent protease, Lon family [Firmicutes bacterium ZCTH02-B6]|nr:MAG: ATP-dependent protease, Lon family [Firmicutes bacterium ZCTH02-B6]